jgi:WD40 repeat protein
MVRIWDAGTGTLQQTLEGHSAGVSAIAFLPDGKRLETNHGILCLDGNGSNPTPAQVGPASEIFIDDDWVFVDGRSILWLPPDIRPSCSFVHGYSIALGCPSGRVFCLRLNI